MPKQSSTELLAIHVKKQRSNVVKRSLDAIDVLAGVKIVFTVFLDEWDGAGTHIP